MKVKDFIKLIRRAVREELKVTARDVVREELQLAQLMYNKTLLENKTLLINDDNNNSNNNTLTSQQKQKKSLFNEKTKFKANSVLNSILNDTMDNMTEEDLNNLENNNELNLSTLDTSVLDTPQIIPNKIKKNIFRDYSSLLKAVERKKRGDGGFRP